MGNGALRRYKKDANENDCWRKPKQQKTSKVSKASVTGDDHNGWRKPKQQVEAVAGSAGPTGGGAGTAKSSAQAAEKTATSWSKSQPAADRAPFPLASDEDDDLTGCSMLADAAAKVWEELMNKREKRKDFQALFVLGEMKDSVERAAKRAECLRREAEAAASRVDKCRGDIEELCIRFEERASAVDNYSRWKLGDIAIRRGKGLCELSMVHHEAEPPYFEVRMVITGTVVGTESTNLLPLTPPQQAQVRTGLRKLELAKADQAKADEIVTQAHEELKVQHQGLADQVEKQLQNSEPASCSTAPAPPMPGLAGSGGAGGRAAPPGLPDMDMVRRWTGAPKDAIPEPAGPPPAVVHAYPDMKGLKEDLRGEGPTSPALAASPRASTAAFGTAPTAAAPPPSNTPAGFPSLDELQSSAQTTDRGQGKSAPQQSYPGVHPGAAKDVFSRAAESSDTGRPSYRRPSKERRHSRTPSTETAPARGVRGVPDGFPNLDVPAGGGGRQSSTGWAAQPQVQSHTQPQAQQPQQQQSVSEWVVYRTHEGTPYYHNEWTGETVWVPPSGARVREPSAATSTAGAAQQGGACYTAYADQQQDFTAAGAAGVPNAEDDPFAELRRQEEQMRQQRDNWAQWYSQYCAWYQGQQPEAGGIPAGQPQGFGAARQPSQAPPMQEAAGGYGATGAAGQEAKLPPKGPAPPQLDAGLEDQALYIMKSTVLKEMEAMVEKGTSLAQRKKALRVLQMRWHPDKNPDRLDIANSVFQFIEETKPWFLHDPEKENVSP